jgi:hypothetical protein
LAQFCTLLIWNPGTCQTRKTTLLKSFFFLKHFWNLIFW